MFAQSRRPETPTRFAYEWDAATGELLMCQEIRDAWAEDADPPSLAADDRYRDRGELPPPPPIHW